MVSQEGDLLRIAVEKPIHKDWLENRLNGRVVTTLRRLGYGHVRVEYVIVSPEPPSAEIGAL